MTKDTWNPEQYERFKAERTAPFTDLLALLEPDGVRTAVDLGSGTGELTKRLAERLGDAQVLGLDASPAMLAKAAAFAGSRLTFAQGSIETWQPPAPVDLIFANASLQWVPDHPRLFARLRTQLTERGQIAVQVPANDDHPSHLVAAELAAEAPFAAALGGYVRESYTLPVEEYAVLLHRLGCQRSSVMLKVYGHTLDAAADVVEWVKGSLLTDYQKRLPPELFARFLAAYTARLLARLGSDKPYFYPFKRILLWGRLG